jgi:hypothetical protein
MARRASVTPGQQHERSALSPRTTTVLPPLAAAERDQARDWLGLLAHPVVAGLLALFVYLWRASIAPWGLGQTRFADFNWLADAFLHGQLGLRSAPLDTRDLIEYGGHLYLYWPPFPALAVAPLVALFGLGVSDVLYTVVIGALGVAFFAATLATADRIGLAPLDAPRRALLTLTMAFGSVQLILAPAGTVWFTAQLLGWVCVLAAALAAFALRGAWGYFLVGLALAAATGTRNALLFNGLWLAFYLLRRDWSRPLRWRLRVAALGLAPVVVSLLLLGWYNLARFGSPLDVGLAWHQMGASFADNFARYGVFNIHYLPTNLRYQFLAYTVFSDERWLGGGIFWMTPLLFGAFGRLWAGRREPLTWIILGSMVLIYLPIGLLLGSGYLTFGPRYLLDLMVPLTILTAQGIRRWPWTLLVALTVIGIATYAYGAVLWQGLTYAVR